ncbi:hypothetical protein IQ238_02140 [Pleurocapsales cyanobacterium LEGE 06147]|nr:hypothetical protein [Pleurocapsales cyanobacterium LEGE 06147]
MSNEPKLQVWQNRLTPIQKIVGDGCYLNGNILQLVAQKFSQIEVEQYLCA